MTVVSILDTLTEWARDSICSKIELKVPPENLTDADDAGYSYRTMNPAAFAMYVPAKDKLPPGIISPVPSVCVRFSKGADRMDIGKGSIGVQLWFSAWNTGSHGKDVLIGSPDGLTWTRWTGEDADKYFRRSGDGWRDAWNMVDIARREIESVTEIHGLLVDRSVPVEFGPAMEQESIPDFYPFWYAWVSFSVTYPIVRNIRGLENFL